MSDGKLCFTGESKLNRSFLIRPVSVQIFQKERTRHTMNRFNDSKIRFADQEIEYKKGFKWLALPYSDIVQAYMRIEEVNGRLCCGTANFDMHFLMLKTQSGELIKIEVSSRELARQMLEELHTINERIEIGYKK